MESNSSYLPSWVTDMRSKLESSKRMHAATEDRIAGLRSSVNELTGMISTSTTQHVPDSAIVNGSGIQEGVTRRMHLLCIPPDTLCLVLGYIDIASVLSFEQTASEMKGYVQSSNFWLVTYFDQYPNFVLSDSANFREFVISKAQCTASSLKFIRVMKEQRCVPRFRSLQPHRYSQSERTISHPMPVFERSSSALMMSRAETMGRDFRSFALSSLQTMCSLTSYELDPIHDRLSSEGVVTVLMSLLTNESGMLQQLSCEILANLLCWEARLVLNCERIAANQRASIGAVSSSPATRINQHMLMSIVDQLQACDGRRQLLSLLTSPSASVNLAQSRSRAQPVPGPGDVKRNGSRGQVIIARTTSSVQGMACKSASRALVNLFCASECVPSPRRDAVIYGDHRVPKIESKLALHVEEEEERTCPRRWGWEALQSMGAATDVQSQDGSVTCRPWKFSYFHKSGFLKDSHDVWLQFSDEGLKMRGRGRDQIGPFFMKGYSEVDIEGLSWHVDKCYLNLSNHGIDGEDDVKIDEWVRNASGDWVTDSDLNDWGKAHVTHTAYISSGVGVAVVAEAHFIQQKRAALAAFNTNNSTNVDSTAMSLQGQEYAMKREAKTQLDSYIAFNSNWGYGMWGVWEASTVGSHYELQKGGVFRATPY